MIELTIRITADSLAEAMSELKSAAGTPACETPQQPIEVHLPATTEEKPEQSQKVQPKTEVKTEQSQETEEVKQEVKPEDVRAMLVKVREAGLDLAKILEPYGSRFPEVNKEDYAALLKDAQDALSNKEAS